MKKFIPSVVHLFFSLFFFTLASAQTSLAPNQNANFAVSRDKYMGIADSVNQYHSTTIHATYKAYDWYEARQERRDQRRQFRREFQLEQARYNRWYPRYSNDRNRYGNNFRNRRYSNHFWCY